jgi:outer membrane protein assembly factor BamD
MKKGLIFKIFLMVVVVGVLTSCRSEFERIRTSTDAPTILEGANQFYKDGDYLKAQTLYEMVIPYYRGRKEAEEIYYKFAYTHYYMKEYILSSHYFKSFSGTFYNSKYEEETDFMSAFSNYKMSPSHRLDQSYSQKAIDGFQIFVNKHPNSQRVDECNQLIDELRTKMEKKDFEQAILYYDLKQYQSALRTFDNLLKEYPETAKAEDIHFYMLQSAYKLADNSIYEKKVERYEDAVKQYSKFIKKFPKSKKAKDAKNIYANLQKKLKSFGT